MVTHTDITSLMGLTIRMFEDIYNATGDVLEEQKERNKK